MKYRKKPVVIEAVQFNAALHPSVLVFDTEDTRYMFNVMVDERGRHIVIETLEGNHRAESGDWIIRGIKGEFYPCKPDIFESTYEAA